MENVFRIRKIRPISGLKRVKSRGKWYVYERSTNAAIIKGFDGSVLELNAKLSGVENAKEIRRHYKAIGSHRYWRGNAAKKLHKTTSSRATYRSLTYELSAQIIEEMLLLARDSCQVTGMPFDYLPKKVVSWKTRSKAPSLDRIDNRKGYTRDNVRLVCVCVNFAINEWGYDHFVEMCDAFMTHRATRTNRDLENVILTRR